MIIGQSIFDAVMARLEEEWEERGEGGAQTHQQAWTGARGLGSSFLLTSTLREDPGVSNMLGKAYFDLVDDEMTADATRESSSAASDFDPAPFERLSLEEIAHDLGISDKDTTAKLIESRRQFARINHPDRVPPEWREKANMRMKIANLLIDEAMKLQKSASGMSKAR
ncbi:hypothetical protein [Rhizobium sp. L1K21]|uniref:hypothetical protein n=1 Tax=Rhizobium sp. L1K21 TaxID=2954933 RepID=UPI0020936ECA|nr:hypothetical protein [Rhizobium sp. L1K21]MCO6185369.1 hypothetical protein [Rhizobium sp. L1K21]